MTGYESKKKAAQAIDEVNWADHEPDDDDAQKYIEEYEARLDIAYHYGYYDGKKAALAERERNFCEKCGKRTADLTTIHTCTPPQEGT